LEFDAVVEGLTIEHLEPQTGEVEAYIRDIIVHLDLPGTP
jgi:hypothetical protein